MASFFPVLLKIPKWRITSAQYPTGYKYETVNLLRLHVFRERNYLLPMQVGEMLRNTALIQTPGW
jgi:hypothetical protein